MFDFDKTLYAYDFRQRLPRLAELTGVSQYRLASRWWSGGFERAAERGRYPTGEAYLEAFNSVTGAQLTRSQWCQARMAAMTPIPSAIEAVRRAAEIGSAALLSNNPMIFGESLPVIASDVAALLGDNVLVSALLGARKPDPQCYTHALARLGARAEDTLFFDDSASNVAGAVAIGMTGHLVEPDRDDDELIAAIERFAATRTR